MSVHKVNLRDIAVLQNREKLRHNKKVGPTERTLLVMGSKNVGKTNIIHQLIEREQGAMNPPSTYLLEYTYGRQSGKSLVKDVCHIWELGSGVTFVSLLPVVAKIKDLNSISVVLVIDLTLPETIINTVDVLLNATKITILESLRNCGVETNREFSSNIEEEDRPHLDPFPIPIVIIGGKYDIFQNTEPAKKRIICQYLRCLAHILQADLLFYSNRDTALVKKARDFLLHYGFGISDPKNTIVTDYNKPLRIPSGCDSFRSIQGPQTTSLNYSLDKYKNSLIAHSNQELSQKENVPDDPVSDTNFEEPIIDNLCKQKAEELKRLKEKLQVMRSIRQNPTA